MWNSLKQAGSEFAFHMGLEIQRDKIVQATREWLSNFTIDQFKTMILKNEMPPISSDMFAEINPYSKFLPSITVEELFELLNDASPELCNMIQSLGEQGAIYIVGLRKYFLKCATHPELAPAIVDVGKQKPPEMVKITCDHCKKTFPWQKDKVSSIKACPFCHTPA
jgi:hypothetical protein